jgi:hypothetical protein
MNLPFLLEAICVYYTQRLALQGKQIASGSSIPVLYGIRSEEGQKQGSPYLSNQRKNKKMCPSKLEIVQNPRQLFNPSRFATLSASRNQSAQRLPFGVGLSSKMAPRSPFASIQSPQP